MKNNGKKKEILAQYKEREIIGGVYLIRNTVNNKLLLDAATDLQSIRNRFEFARKTGSCVNPQLQSDWSGHGSGAFVFEVLEELKKTSAQTENEFKAEVYLMKDIWFEQLSKCEDMY